MSKISLTGRRRPSSWWVGLVASAVVVMVVAGLGSPASAAPPATNAAPATRTPATLQQSPPPNQQPQPAPTADQPLLDAEGNLSMPMPSLAAEPLLLLAADGTVEARFEVHYDVWNPVGSADHRADQSVLTLMVASELGNAGPSMTSPMFTQVLVDDQLDALSITRSYRFPLPANASDFLLSNGLIRGLLPTVAADGSVGPPPAPGKDAEAPTDAALAAHRDALRHVQLSTQLGRDFKHADGIFDWSQGRAWTAADGPVTESITDSSTFTVSNNTDNWGQTDGTKTATDWNSLGVNDSYGIPVSLAGQPVECIGQGGGSNPTGFQLMNAFDVQQNLMPGLLPVGTSVTQQVNADDSLSANGLAEAQDLTTGSVQVAASVMGTTTPGLKSAMTTAGMMLGGITEITGIPAVLLMVPIKAIGQLVSAIVSDATDSCADYSNIFNLTAVEPSGSASSYSWADQTDGLFINYAAATYGTAPTVDQNVAQGPSIGVMSEFIDDPNDDSNDEVVTVNPYLTQFSDVGCGSSAHGLVNNTGSCGSSGNNVLSLAWSVNDPCPKEIFSDCVLDESDLGVFPVEVPGSDLCGPNNELCPVLAAPIPDGSDVTNQFYLAGNEGAAYTVLKEWNPDDAVTAMVAGTIATPGQGDDLYLGWQSGRVTLSSAADFDPADNVQFTLPGAVTAMAVLDGTLYISDDQGGNYTWAPGQGQPTRFPGAFLSSLTMDQIATTTGWVFWAGGGGVFAYNPSANAIDQFFGRADVQVTSLTVTGDQVVAGYSDGVILTCPVGTYLCADPSTKASFDGPVQAVTGSGNVVYAGLGNGNVERLNLTNDAQDTMWLGSGEDAQTAGMTVADGVLYFGGCFDVTNPITGDLLGVFAVTSTPPEGQAFFAASPDPEYGSECVNSSSADNSEYKGFQPTQYAITSAQPDPGYPSIVYVALTINSGSFLYALQNVLPPTANLCYASAGNCPVYTTTAPTPVVATVPAPAAGLNEFSAPTMATNCTGPGFTTPTFTPAGNGVSFTTANSATTVADDGFQLTFPVSDSQNCVTNVGFSLNNLGTLPYDLWTANAYLDASAPDGSSASITINSGFASQNTGTDNDWGPGMVAGSFTDNDGVLNPQGPYPFGTSVDRGPPRTTIGSGGTQLVAPLSGAEMLVLTITAFPGDAGSLVFADDQLFGPDTVPSLPPLAGTAPLCDFLGLASVPAGSLVYPLGDLGALMTDIGGNGWNGLAYGAATTRPQVAGPKVGCPGASALSFGDAPTVVVAPQGAGVAATGSALTVLAWINPADSQTGHPSIVATDDTGQTAAGFQLSTTSTNGVLTAMTFDVGGGNGVVGTVTATAPGGAIDPGQWHQLVGTWDGATMSLYLDGQLQGSAAYTEPLTAGGYPVTLGLDPTAIADAASGDDPASGGDPFAGAMADVAVLPVALTADQVAAQWTTPGIPLSTGGAP